MSLPFTNFLILIEFEKKIDLPFFSLQNLKETLYVCGLKTFIKVLRDKPCRTGGIGVVRNVDQYFVEKGKELPKNLLFVHFSLNPPQGVQILGWIFHSNLFFDSIKSLAWPKICIFRLLSLWNFDQPVTYLKSNVGDFMLCQFCSGAAQAHVRTHFTNRRQAFVPKTIMITLARSIW